MTDTHHPADPIREALEFLDEVVNDYIDDYELRGEDEDGRDVCYTPTEVELGMISDAIHGLLAEVTFVSAFVQWQEKIRGYRVGHDSTPGQHTTTSGERQALERRFTLDELAEACCSCEIGDAKYESLCIALAALSEPSRGTYQEACARADRWAERQMRGEPSPPPPAPDGTQQAVDKLVKAIRSDAASTAAALRACDFLERMLAPPSLGALPPLPGHPEPHTHMWTTLELACIEAYGRECWDAGRAAISSTQPKEGA
jgi:hypothetical protein